MDRAVSRWAPGASYGPILSQTDLYLLGTKLELNPILEGKSEHALQFHILSGLSVSNQMHPNGENNVIGKDEPATLPRVSQIIIVSKLSPWCTIIKRDAGVTIGDICTAVFKDYTEHDITDAEFKSLNQRAQEQLKRTAGANFNAQQPPGGQGGWGGYYPSPAPSVPDRLRRVDWLRERVYFEGLSRADEYIRSRLGFNAPNTFVMELTS